MSGEVVEGSVLPTYHEESCGHSASSSDALTTPYLPPSGATTATVSRRPESESSNSRVSFRDDVDGGDVSKSLLRDDDLDSNDEPPSGFVDDGESGYSSNALTVPWAKDKTRGSIGHTYRNTFGRDTEEDLMYGRAWGLGQQMHSEMDDDRVRQSVMTDVSEDVSGIIMVFCISVCASVLAVVICCCFITLSNV